MFSNKAYSISSILFVGIFIVLDKFNLHLLPFQWMLAILSVIMIVSLCSTSEKMPPPIKAALKNTEDIQWKYMFYTIFSYQET